MTSFDLRSTNVGYTVLQFHRVDELLGKVDPTFRGHLRMSDDTRRNGHFGPREVVRVRCYPYFINAVNGSAARYVGDDILSPDDNVIGATIQGIAEPG